MLVLGEFILGGLVAISLFNYIVLIKINNDLNKIKKEKNKNGNE